MTVDSLADEQLTVETIVQGFVEDGPMGHIGRKIIKCKAKEMAIQDAIMAIRENNSLSVEDTQKMIR